MTIQPRVYTAQQVAQLYQLPVSTIYELARREPKRYGVVREGRAVRFRRDVIDARLQGDVAQDGQGVA